MMNINQAHCPECNHRLKLGAHPHQGRRIICSECETSLTITSVNPLELDLTMSINQAESIKKRPHTMEVPCPECEELLRINPRTHQGHRVRCSGCDTVLEVRITNPLELDIASTAGLKYSYRDASDEEPRHPGKKAGRAKR